MIMLNVLVFTSVVMIVSCQVSVFQPEQIHIAMAGQTGMRIMWFTEQTTVASLVNFGLSSPDERSATGSAEMYLVNSGSHHVVHLDNLELGSTYKYTVGDGSTMSEVLEFTTPPKDDFSGDINLAVFGDMGYLDSVSRPMGIIGSYAMAGNWSSTFSRETLERWKNSKEIDFVWHVGDIGYADDAAFHTIITALQFSYEDAYNGYMNWLQNITSTLPYHVLPGNHESECHDPACVVNSFGLGLPLSNFTAFNARWKMPSQESGGVASMWYSFDYGAVHFVSINTETDFDGAAENEKGDSGIFPAGHFAPEGAYLAWLEADLQKASQDPNVRWIFAGGHRPFTSFNSTQVDAMFIKYNVSLYFAGHYHSYSRYDASEHGGVTTHITVGGAGCDEMPYAADNPQQGKRSGGACEASADYQPPPSGHGGVATDIAHGSAICEEAEDSRFDARDACEAWKKRQNQEDELFSCQGAQHFTDAYAIGRLSIADGGRGDVVWKLVSSIDGSVLDSFTLLH